MYEKELKLAQQRKEILIQKALKESELNMGAEKKRLELDHSTEKLKTDM